MLGLLLLRIVPKARLEQEPQENLQKAYCFELVEGIYTLRWQHWDDCYDKALSRKRC